MAKPAFRNRAARGYPHHRGPRLEADGSGGTKDPAHDRRRQEGAEARAGPGRPPGQGAAGPRGATRRGRPTGAGPAGSPAALRPRSPWLSRVWPGRCAPARRFPALPRAPPPARRSHLPPAAPTCGPGSGTRPPAPARPETSPGRASARPPPGVRLPPRTWRRRGRDSGPGAPTALLFWLLCEPVWTTRC